eukprot:g9194.t1
MGGGRYADNRFQDAGPLSSPPPARDTQMSLQLSVADSDGGDLLKGTEGGWGAACAGEEGVDGVRVVNDSIEGQRQGGTGGVSGASKTECTSNPTKEKMLEAIGRKNSVEDVNGIKPTRIGSGSSKAAGAGKEATDGTASTEAMGAPGEDGEMEEGDEETAQRLFIGWMQARQREFLTVLSLGCVTALFINHMSTSYSGTLPVMVALIPVVVHLLLVRDIYVKWEHRQRRKACRHSRSLSGRTDEPHRHDERGQGAQSAAKAGPGGVVEGVDGLGSVGRPGISENRLAEGRMNVQQNGAGSGGGDGGGGEGGGVAGGGAYGSPKSTSTNDSNNSSLPWDAMGSSSRGAPAARAPESEDNWSDFAGRGGSEGVNVMNLLETPFQKSVRLLNTACENVNDPVVRKVLKTVAKLLSDPDSLHQVKEGSIRRVTMDLGTRNYIENVLQTPVRSTSAENWKKLRTSIFVVSAMAREAAAAEDFLSTYKTRHTIKEERLSEDEVALVDVDGGLAEQKDSELDALLEDIESGLDTTSQDVVTLNANNGASRAEGSAKKAEPIRFSVFNRRLIQGQQLVAKTLSQGDLRKDPDRLSVKELRDLVSEYRMPEESREDLTMQAESVASNEDMEGIGDHPQDPKALPSHNIYEEMNIPRLPILPEDASGNVALLLADGGFLQWDFNVFTLEERSQGHSLWFAAMLAFSHYNIIGAFGLSVDRLSQLFLCVESSYCYSPEAPNTYHTHVHAADVTLTVSHFLSVEAIANTVRSTHGLALLMAAIMHDYRHPGVNNGYLVRDLDPLAVVYNDASVLENFHAAEGFKMLLDPAFGILRGWKAEDVKFFRHAFVKCILATDLALSLEYVSKFQSLTASMASAELSRSAELGGSKLGGNEINNNNSIQVQISVLQMILKVADVAHPCKPWEVHHKWSELVTEEFFKQGDKEAARGLAVSPLCDRSDQNLAKSQCDFIDFIVRPCVSIFSMYCKVTTWNDQLDSNFRAWKAMYEEQGGAAQRLSSPGSKRRSLR